MLSFQKSRVDDGSVLLLAIGYALVAAVLVVVAVDVSAVFLARRSLAATADAAALAAAQGVDRAALYAGDGACGARLALDPAQATASANSAVADAADDLRGPFRRLDPPAVELDATTARVTLAGEAKLPLAGILAVLLPGHGDAVHVTVSSAASTAVTGDTGC